SASQFLDPSALTPFTASSLHPFISTAPPCPNPTPPLLIWSRAFLLRILLLPTRCALLLRSPCYHFDKILFQEEIADPIT
ncbi:hypothetical protein BHE74_00004682, partial [Ensete ventricosum]